MPTRRRHDWAQRAVECFLEQSYTDKQLLILDDPDEPSFPGGSVELPASDRIIYILDTQRGKVTIGDKRNRMLESATGEIIQHFDSDDWSDPKRMAYQVAFLEASGKQVVGFHTMLFVDEDKQKAWKYYGPQGIIALGTSLTYYRSWWLHYKFPAVSIGEDNAIVRKAQQTNQLATSDCGAMQVARVHRDNSSPKRMNSQWKPIPVQELPKGFNAI